MNKLHRWSSEIQSLAEHNAILYVRENDPRTLADPYGGRLLSSGNMYSGALLELSDGTDTRLSATDIYNERFSEIVNLYIEGNAAILSRVEKKQKIP